MGPENKATMTMSMAFTCHDWPIPLWESRQEGLRQSLNFNVHHLHLHLQPPAIAQRHGGYHLPPLCAPNEPEIIWT